MGVPAAKTPLFEVFGGEYALLDERLKASEFNVDVRTLTNLDIVCSRVHPTGARFELRVPLDWPQNGAKFELTRDDKPVAAFNASEAANGSLAAALTQVNRDMEGWVQDQS